MHVQEVWGAVWGGWPSKGCFKIEGAGLDKTLIIQFRSIGVFNS